MEQEYGFKMKFEIKFAHMARTLDPDYIRDGKTFSCCGESCQSTHENGWTISGEIHEDYYEWVNRFDANHPMYGRVWGDFEDVVYADSEEGYNDFVKNFPPAEWDYLDI